MAAVVITFNPDGMVLQRLLNLRQQVRCLVIVDNGSRRTDHLDPFQSDSGVRILANSDNFGVAKALNQGVRVLDMGFEWILTMDQDSETLPELVPAAQRAYAAFPYRHLLSVIGADYNSPFHHLVVEQDRDDLPYRIVKTVITSGALLRRSIFEQLGGFRDELFIDSVDDEYCLRAQARGFHVIQAKSFGISHKIGEPYVFHFLGRRRSTSNHSPMRRYYMARNRLLLSIRFAFTEPRWVLRVTKAQVRDLIFIALFERAKRAKLYASLLGVRDALFGAMGRLDESRLIPDNSRSP